MYLTVEQALIDSFLDFEPNAPIEFPNAPLSNIGDGIWYKLSNIRGKSNPVTLGINGETNHPGIFQITICVPINQGTGEILSKVEAINNHYSIHAPIKKDNTIIHLQSVSASQGIIKGDATGTDSYYSINVEIVYYSRSHRS